MDKRYSVFLSSTYTDLKDERQKVIQTLMEMDCFPCGMELFPALDEEQFEFIKKVIDDCDYYLLIIGGRYGSITSEGISYTEKEYDYAISKGIKVLAFLHGKPDEIPTGKTDKDPALSAKLEKFRTKVGQGRLVKFWKTAGELPGLVALSLPKTIKTYPAVGWVRSTSIGSSELLSEIHELRKENDELKSQLSLARNELKLGIENIAEIDQEIEIFGTYGNTDFGVLHDWAELTSWKEIFGIISPHLLPSCGTSSIKNHLARGLLKRSKIENYDFVSLNDDIFLTIKIQLLAYDFIVISDKQVGNHVKEFWQITEKGKKLMFNVRTVKAS